MMKTKTQKNPKAKRNVSRKASTTLGPIADLEKHLPGDWWRHLFNSIYLKTDADVVENDENTTREIEFLLELTGVQSSHRVLDLCCGQGRHSLVLAEQGFPNVTGLDRSRYLIRLARKRAREKSLRLIQFKEGDARKIGGGEGAFDLVMVMGNSFGYFEREEENQAVLKEIYRVLSEGGTLFLDITDGKWMKENYQPKSWEWIDQKMMVCRERHLAKDGNRLVTREVVIDSNKGIIADQFYAERIYSFEELETCLKETGFTDVKVHSNVQAESTRSQPDLGMMASRLFISAKANNKPVSFGKSIQIGTNHLECIVLLGDPSLPDKIKLEGHFNQDDLNTVEEMKKALSNLEGYNFTFLDSHQKMIDLLQRQPPSFVLNLCDEGFQNNPLQELHVPALLEMFNIPYSGAGPSCLAICYNKGLVNAWAKEMGVPTPDEIWIDSSNFSAALPSVFPTLVKPAFGDSSMGIMKEALVHNSDELVGYFDYLKQEFPGIPILVQEYLEGREFTVGLIGNGENINSLPILEVDYSSLPSDLPRILGYESKWMPDSPYWKGVKYEPASLTDEQARELIDNAILLFQRFGCRDYARFDFRMDSNGVMKLLEINPNPGWCWDGKFNLMAQMGGMSYSELLEEVLKAARSRYGI